MSFTTRKNYKIHDDPTTGDAGIALNDNFTRAGDDVENIITTLTSKADSTNTAQVVTVGTLTASNSDITTLNATTGSVTNTLSVGTLIATTGTITTLNANTVSATLSGNGSGITALSASNVSAGTLGDTYLTTNVPLKNGTNTFSAVNTFSTLNATTGTITTLNANTVSATLSGNGSGVTALSASNVSAGTLGDTYLTTNVPLKNGTNTFSAVNTFSTLTATNAATIGTLNATTGTITTLNANTVSATLSGNGASITALNASNVSSGTLANTYLTNVALTTATNTFSIAQIMSPPATSYSWLANQTGRPAGDGNQGARGLGCRFVVNNAMHVTQVGRFAVQPVGTVTHNFQNHLVNIWDSTTSGVVVHGTVLSSATEDADHWKWQNAVEGSVALVKGRAYYLIVDESSNTLEWSTWAWTPNENSNISVTDYAYNGSLNAWPTVDTGTSSLCLGMPGFKFTLDSEAPLGLTVIGSISSTALSANKISTTAVTQTAVTGTVTLDASTANTFVLTAAGSFAVANMTNTTDGQNIILKINNTGTATFTPTLGASFSFGSDITALTPIAVGKTDIIGLQFNGSSAQILTYTRGF